MGERRALERALRSHYRDGGACPAPPRRLVEAVAVELARPARPRASAVLAEQARRVGALGWGLHVALALLALPMALLGPGPGTAAVVVGAALALASLAELTRSRSSGMAELEAACAVNAQAVALARVVVLGCADALAMLAVALLAADGRELWAVLAQGCAPYLAAAGAGLLAARRVASADATAAAVGAGAGVCAACVALRMLWPAAFAPAAGLAWWVAAACALGFAALEVRAWLRASASAFADAAPRAAGVF